MAQNPVRIPITATNKTAQAFSQVNKGLKSMGSFAGQTAMKIGKIGLAFATVGVATATVLTKSSMQSIDALAKTADQLGITTEALGGLQHAAGLAGVENKTFEKSLQNLAIGVSDAANNTGVAKDAFLELGISAAALEKLPIDQQMLVVADAMKDVELQTDKVRIAADLFGARGVAMLNVIAGGSADLKQMAAEAEHLGITMSRVDAAEIELANDAVEKATGVFTGLGNQLAKSFSPIITAISTEFYQAALDTEGFGNIGQDVAGGVVTAFGNVMDVVQRVSLAIMQLKLIALNVKGALQDVFEPTAAAAEYAKQEAAMNKMLIAGKIGHGEFSRWQIENQKKVRDGTFMVNGEIKEGAKETQDEIARLMEKMTALTSAELPSDRIEAFYQRAIAVSAEAGQVIADNAPGKVVLEDLNKNASAVLERISFNEEQQIEGKKRLDAFNQKSGVAQTKQVVGELSNQFSAIASNNKKLFAVNKAFQIGQAIMQTYSAATLALASYPPPLGFVMAAGAVVNGLGQVAQIRSQSFEGGGFTGRGARAGGLDGKGGYMAMVHPNESVIDHTKGGGGGVTIINNIDATGGADVDMKIRQAVTQATNASVATIQDLMRRRRFA
tara:strand:+ start:5624 stop:7468 length:1845 start_codon:yes stop_codon:yes gene_type:complete